MGDVLAALNEFLPKWIEKESKRGKPRISMLSFLKTGRFGPIDLNSRREEVYEYLERPPAYAFSSFFGYQEASFWTYDGMEFYFDDVNDRDRLTKIYNDWLTKLGNFNTRAFEVIDPFFLDDEEALLNNIQIEEKLNANDIGFQYYKRSFDGSLMILCESGVQIELQMDKRVNGGFGIYEIVKTPLAKFWIPVTNS